MSSVTLRSDGAAAEEVDRAAFAHQFHCFLPCLGHADGFNGDIDAPILRRERARLADGFANVAGLHDVGGAQLARCFHLAVVLDDGDGFVSCQRRDVQNHQARADLRRSPPAYPRGAGASLQSRARRRPAAQSAQRAPAARGREHAAYSWRRCAPGCG